MITIDIKPAKRRFSNRKQWKFAIAGGNGEPIDPRETYANVGDILEALQTVREDQLRIRIHYADRPRTLYIEGTPVGTPWGAAE